MKTQHLTIYLVHLMAILCIFPGMLWSQSSDSAPEKVDPFVHNRYLFYHLKYLNEAKWRSNHDAGLAAFLDSAKHEGFSFQPANQDHIRINYRTADLNPNVSLAHYETPDGKCWLDWISHPSPDTILAESRRLRKDRLRYTIGGNTSFRRPKAFIHYLTYQTGDHPAGVNLFLQTEQHILNIGLDLDFPIRGQYDALDNQQRIKVRDRFADMRTLVRLLISQLVHPDEWIKKPLGSTPMTAEQRLYGFMQFWTEVKYNFAFFDQVPELNWDQVLYEYLPVIQQDQSDKAYYRTLERICAMLNDGHTNIYPPYFPGTPEDRPSIVLQNFDKKAFVINTTSYYAEEAPLGSEIIAVDGIPTPSFLTDSVFPYLSSSTEHIRYDRGIEDMLTGDKGTKVKLTFIKPDGERADMEVLRDGRKGGYDWVRPRKNWRLFSFQKREHDIAHIELNSFGNKDIIAEFEERLDSIKACKGIIIDLRKNGGGSSTIGYEILKYFTDKPFKGSASRTRSHLASHKAWGQFLGGKPLEELNEFDRISKLTLAGNYWHEFEPTTIVPNKPTVIDLPLVVLIGHQTASAAEDFLVALDQIGIAKLIGEPTFGSTGQPLMMDLPGGGRARICTKRDTYPDGREFVGFGIQPDIPVAPSVKDYLADKDVVLDFAIQHLQKRIQKRN